MGTWQIALDTTQAVGLGFTASLASVGMACTLAFYLGLRLMRRALSPIMKAVEPNNYANLKADYGLSCAVGGATGFFVGTDVTFGASNWLINVVGIKEGVAAIAGMCLAGLSTSLGFMATQFIQALFRPKGKCWIDP